MKPGHNSTRHPAANALSVARLRQILSRANRQTVAVVGDVMLDQFIWGKVGRISPEAPVPVVDFERESFMPGGAANVARNLAALGAHAEVFGITGRDLAAHRLGRILKSEHVGCHGLTAMRDRPTSVKTRIVAHQQQVVRIDHERRDGLSKAITSRLIQRVSESGPQPAAIVVGDYGKGTVTQPLLEALRALCHERGTWLSLDPKPVHELGLTGLSLLTPNRKEAFELAGLADDTRNPEPLSDANLLAAAQRLLAELHPEVLLITLGELGMLLCLHGQPPIHIPTVAQEVFDVSGAGDTVIAAFTFAIVGGASPVEAAVLSNHAAGVVVGKVGTATVSPEELVRSFALVQTRADGGASNTQKSVRAMPDTGRDGAPRRPGTLRRPGVARRPYPSPKPEAPPGRRKTANGPV